MRVLRHIAVPSRMIEDAPKSVEEMFAGVLSKQNFPQETKHTPEQLIAKLRAKLQDFPSWLRCDRRFDLDDIQDSWETFQDPLAPDTMDWMLEMWQNDWRVTPPYIASKPKESAIEWVERRYKEGGYVYLAPESIPVTGAYYDKMPLPILKLRLGATLDARLFKASDYYRIDKAEIVRMAIRRARKRSYVVPKENTLDSTYGGTVLDVPLGKQEDKATAHEARESLNWYLLQYEPIPEPLILNIENIVAIQLKES